jgi:hypothetical protein
MREPGSVRKLLRESRNILAPFLLQGEKARMRASFKNDLHLKSKPGYQK